MFYVFWNKSTCSWWVVNCDRKILKEFCSAQEAEVFVCKNIKEGENYEGISKH